MKKVLCIMVMVFMVLTTTVWAYSTSAPGGVEQSGVTVTTSGNTTTISTSYVAQPQVPPGSEAVGLTMGGKSIIIQNDVQPFINGDNRTMIPLRVIAVLLGCDVSYDAATGTITIHQGTTTITLVIGSNVVTVNGKAVSLDSPATIFNNRTVVPLRFISEILGHEVNYVNGVININ